VVSLFLSHERSGIRITHLIAQSKWLGERVDDQMAVEDMLSLE